jgi:type VI secretion system protein ImpM
MNRLPASPGFYGKLPVRGDFVSRRLPASFVSPWDAWLQRSLSTSRSELGDEWLEIYLTSPIWRFVVSREICGDHAFAGILMPSVDKVGRYFPLTLAAPIDNETSLARLFFSEAEWFGKIEELALSALEDSFDLEDFDLALQNLISGTPPQPKDPKPAVEWPQDRFGQTASLFSDDEATQIREAFVNLSSGLLERFSPAYSIWCTSGSERVKPSLLVFAGLPPPQAFAEFMTGKAQQRDIFRPGVSAQAVIQGGMDASGPDKPLNNATLAWRSRARSIVGKVRKINEDAFLERPETGIWAVADGMGGHREGQAASRAVVNALAEISKTAGIEELTRSVVGRLHGVNRDLMEMARAYGPNEVIGSTVVVMLADGDRCAGVWAGDSRLYRFRDGVLEQLTRDHSLAGELSRSGSGREDEYRGPGIDGVLTRAVGAENDLAVDTISWQAREGDVFLLCSDGLVREVAHKDIEGILSENDIEQNSQTLMDAAVRGGARDNVTVVLVHAVSG